MLSFNCKVAKKQIDSIFSQNLSTFASFNRLAKANKKEMDFDSCVEPNFNIVNLQFQTFDPPSALKTSVAFNPTCSTHLNLHAHPGVFLLPKTGDHLPSVPDLNGFEYFNKRIQFIGAVSGGRNNKISFTYYCENQRKIQEYDLNLYIMPELFPLNISFHQTVI